MDMKYIPYSSVKELELSRLHVTLSSVMLNLKNSNL